MSVKIRAMGKPSAQDYHSLRVDFTIREKS